MSYAWAFRFAIPLAMVCVCMVGAQKPSEMTFFITSVGPGKGGDFGGIEGADKHCQQLAQAAGAGNRTWRAYLSVTAPKPVHAKDRIGAGPWQNVKGVVVATSVADLHSDANKLSKENSVSEKGDIVNGRGDKPNRHDILTGSHPDGTPGAKPATTGRAVPKARRTSATTIVRAVARRRPRGTRPIPARPAVRRISQAPAGMDCFTASRRNKVPVPNVPGC